MSRNRVFGVAVVVGLLALSGRADGPNFIPDSTFKGSTLSGWHVLGDADWSARDGELSGKAKTGGKGGWLALDQGDDEIGRFLTYLVAALRRADPDLARSVPALLESSPILPVERLAAFSPGT